MLLVDSKAALLPKENPTSPEANDTVNGPLKDSRELLRIELAFMVPFFIISLYSLVTVVYSSAVTYHDNKPLTLGAMLSDIKWAWKGGVPVCHRVFHHCLHVDHPRHCWGRHIQDLLVDHIQESCTFF
ncbi:hypothetical protein QJS10_CPA07g01392 [Acorus calamus]|uniref:Uncharacterized protein n=1 Tax=Acorus calamus TaxID=4465 RepID=A0AAV9EG11_ACOCL|nr:hypothetical protein QJS10_CPA07g01392 [Acorus calamus]